MLAAAVVAILIVIVSSSSRRGSSNSSSGSRSTGFDNSCNSGGDGGENVVMVRYWLFSVVVFY